MNKFWSSMVKRTDPYVPGEQLNEPDLLKLNTNENPYPPSPKVFEAIQKETENLKLYPSPTADDLRTEIASHFNLAGKENIFIGNGSDEVLAFSFMAFFEPSEAIRFPAVTYSFYPVYAKIFDIPYVETELNEDFSIKPEALFNAQGGVIFPNPNAPTSIYLPLQSVQEVLKNNPDKVVIVDEAYIDFAGESAATLISEYDNLLVIQTTSKSRSLAGLRVGYALGQKHLIDALIRIKDSFNSYTIDRLALAGALASFRDKAYFKEHTAKIIATREKTAEQLHALGFSVIPSSANFLFAKHESKKAEEIYLSLKERNVLVRHFGKQPIDNYLRITVGTDAEMDRLIDTLKKII
ncbi:histidinol-phosphate transaminase [Aciduricibacillus chroicocephali]|uniref:Histidinol-phosphate aminotransferase n=1 Tax=Aciduricibacillus chroicocephali TaxID=3054939 RepID=A0ABY9KWR5_9BACI|nr:histidinol-phosphate transaminase [Bacillaceae bacterium 44XB]